MSPPRIREYLHRKPFVPFTVVTGDGSSVRVKSPEHALLAPGGRTLIVTTGRQVDGQDEIEVLDVFLITKLLTVDAPTLSEGLVSDKSPA